MSPDREFYEKCITEQIRLRPDRGSVVKNRTAENHTIGDFGDAVMAIHNAHDAIRFYNGYVEQMVAIYNHSQKKATEVARANIGWFFGEGMPEKDIRIWSRVCEAYHPVFGKSMVGVTAEKAFEAGLAHGAKARAKTTTR